MLRRLLKSPILYVRLRAERMHVRDPRSAREYVDEPVLAIASGPETVVAVGRAARDLQRRDATLRLASGFDHPRTIISDFTVAVRSLQHALRELLRRHWLRPSPVLVIHPLEKLDGGLTQVEDRALRELGIAAGARAVHVWTGREFADHEFRDGLPSALTGPDAR